MITIRDRTLPGKYRIALTEDSDRNRWIEVSRFTDAGELPILSMGPSNKLYRLFEAMMAAPPMISDEELLKIYESSTEGISHKYGRVLAYARAVIEVTRKVWGL